MENVFSQIDKDVSSLPTDTLDGFLRRTLYVIAQHWTPDSDIKKIRKYAKAFTKIEDGVYEYTGALDIAKNWDTTVDIIAEQIRHQMLVQHPWAPPAKISFDILDGSDGTMIIKPKFL